MKIVARLSVGAFMFVSVVLGGGVAHADYSESVQELLTGGQRTAESAGTSLEACTGGGGHASGKYCSGGSENGKLII